MPSPVINKAEDGVVGVPARSHNPQRNDDDKYTEYVQDEYEHFNQWQAHCKEDVEECAECHDGDCEYSRVPRLDRVAFDVEHGESKNHASLRK